MSGWDSYAISVRDLSAPGECVGAGIYGNDGNGLLLKESIYNPMRSNRHAHGLTIKMAAITLMELH